MAFLSKVHVLVDPGMLVELCRGGVGVSCTSKLVLVCITLTPALKECEEGT